MKKYRTLILVLVLFAGITYAYGEIMVGGSVICNGI